MLSRIAESLFWIGRYVERGDDTARILDVHLQLLSEEPWAEEPAACRSLLTIMDHPAQPEDGPVGRETVLRLLAHDLSNPSSIAGALVAARENARRAREIVSTDLWEALNTTRHRVVTVGLNRRPHEFFAWVRERAAVVTGLMESATPHDATWHFMVLGQSIERADMTARLLTTQARLGSAGPGWTSVLRSCGAHEAYLRAHRGRTSDDDAAAFLVLDRLFPRSIVYALGSADAALRALEPAESRREVSDEALRSLGAVRSRLEFTRRADTIGDLPAVMEQVQHACARASEAIRDRYFPSPTTAAAWVGEAL